MVIPVEQSCDGHSFYGAIFCVCFLQFDKNTLTDQALELLSLVPEGYIPLPHQIGGHRHVDGKLGERGREGGRREGRERGTKGGRVGREGREREREGKGEGRSKD